MYLLSHIELDGVGPIDNRLALPLGKKNIYMYILYIWHITCDMWQVGGGEPSFKISAP